MSKHPDHPTCPLHGVSAQVRTLRLELSCRAPGCAWRDEVPAPAEPEVSPSGFDRSWEEGTVALYESLSTEDLIGLRRAFILDWQAASETAAFAEGRLGLIAQVVAEREGR